MAPGPHVFGDGRIGVWIINNENLTDKLKHVLPRLRGVAEITDVFLPREATLAHKQQVSAAGLYSALYETPPHGMSATDYSARAIKDVDRLKAGALELNIEGLADEALDPYIRTVVRNIRKVKPYLRLRINVVPWKGQFLPADLFVADSQLYLIAQCFLGNMDARVAENELVRDLTDYGIDEEKVSVMYCAMVGVPRVRALPQIRYRGSIFSDDLLLDAGLI